jgi:hypothetical protein
MKPAIDSYVYQTEFQTDSNGNRWQKVWRRRVLDMTQDRIRLSAADSMRLPIDWPGDFDWEPCTGMQGMELSLSWHRFGEKKFSNSFSLARGAA